MTALYNEIDDYAADWLENLIAAGLIAPGVVDRRSIVDLQPADLAGFTQVHFFAGIGGWSLAARLAGWPDDRPLWTGSCPCQPFSVAGKQAGQADERHLWPVMFDLVRSCRPPVVMGEQVAAAVGKSWLDGVCSDLEGIDYTCGAAVVPACAVDAPHRRDRLWFVADTASERRREGFEDAAGVFERIGPQGETGRTPERRDHFHVADGDVARLEGWPALRERRDERTTWADSMVVSGADGKARRVKPGVRLLAHGVSGRVAVQRPTGQGDAEAQETHWYNRVGALRAFGNAIVPQVAAEIIGAYMDCTSNLC
jgi:DNA (cytosine-5)-methyltransferase 1